jgi:hypothetical protein
LAPNEQRRTNNLERTILEMRKSSALIFAGVGLVLAVGLPITIALVWEIDLGKRQDILVGGSAPGICLMAIAGKLWRRACHSLPEFIPPGYLVCELCGKAAKAEEGVTRRLDMARFAFVCHACSRYRTKRALIILLVFLGALGLFALIVQLTIGAGK